MKAKIPKAWDSLSRNEKDAITEYCRKEAEKIIYEEEAGLQITWMKLCCILLHDAFGFGEMRLYRFLANWKRMYKINKKLGNKADQDAYLEGQMKKLFRKSGFPDEFVERLKEI